MHVMIDCFYIIALAILMPWSTPNANDDEQRQAAATLLRKAMKAAQQESHGSDFYHKLLHSQLDAHDSKGAVETALYILRNPSFGSSIYRMTNGYRMTRKVKKYPTLLRLIDHSNIQDWVRDKIDSQRQIAALKSSMVWDVGQSDLEQAVRIARSIPGDPKTISVEHFQSDAIESEKLEAWQKLVTLCLNQDNPERARELVMKFSDPAVRSYLVSNAIEESNKNSSAAAKRLVELIPDKYAKADLDRELRMRIDKTNLVESIEEQRKKSSATGQVDVSALVRISRLLRKQDEPERALELIRPGIDYLKSNPNPMHQR